MKRIKLNIIVSMLIAFFAITFAQSCGFSFLASMCLFLAGSVNALVNFIKLDNLYKNKRNG